MTMTQKILAAHAGLKEVTAGQLITCKLDLVHGNDITTPVAVNVFKNIGVDHVFDKEKVSIVPDHFVPNKDIKSAEQCKYIREFAHKMGIVNFFEVGQMGIEHALLPEKGLVVAGDVVIGADSHTCTYGALGAFSTGVGSTDMACGMATGEAWFKVPGALKFNLTGKLQKNVSGKDVILHIIGMIGVDGALYKSMEFSGEGLKNLSMDSRLCMANMAIEAGAKNGIFAVDEVTLDYCKKHSKKTPVVYEADPDAIYDEVYEIGPKEVKIDQVVIGSCTNGRMEDLRIAHEILKGKKVDPNIRVIIIPGTQKIYLEAIAEGIIQDLVEAGCAVSTPTCGPCLGGYMGILAAGERCVSTTNRNFVGRMGHVDSEVYLASPATAAASALTGYITNPDLV